MYQSIQVPWSAAPSPAELAYKSAGLVRTQGTLFMLPPDREALSAAFIKPPRPKTLMSSGAVALCKHFERGGASSEHGKAHPFWPLPKGSNEKKSAMAAEILEQLLDDSAWKNMMMLHPGVAVYEIRNSLGYGMRWTLQVEEDELAAGRPSMQPSSTSEGVEGTNSSEPAQGLRTSNISFRGCLEPIIGLDHELPVSKIAEDTPSKIDTV